MGKQLLTHSWLGRLLVHVCNSLPVKLREAWVWHLAQWESADQPCTGIRLIKTWVSCIKISAHSTLVSQFNYNDQLNGESREHACSWKALHFYGWVTKKIRWISWLSLTFATHFLLIIEIVSQVRYCLKSSQCCILCSSFTLTFPLGLCILTTSNTYWLLETTID